MKAVQGQLGRVFLLRLSDGDKVPGSVEQFAAENKIKYAQVNFVGGIGKGQVVTGPRYSEQMPPDPVLLPVDGAHETIAVGVMAPDADGKPVLHIHAALGRSGQTLTGCLRPGVETWLVGEVIIFELIGLSACRLVDPKSGFALLEVNP
jgi:uncharacterized protein